MPLIRFHNVKDLNQLPQAKTLFGRLCQIVFFTQIETSLLDIWKNLPNSIDKRKIFQKVLYGGKSDLYFFLKYEC